MWKLQTLSPRERASRVFTLAPGERAVGSIPLLTPDYGIRLELHPVGRHNFKFLRRVHDWFGH
jgi:hypothetical protein